jgi:glycosyltransferase involved in cell wall biosynthesis
MDKPVVSVVMATYNEPVDFIVSAIESVLNQTIRNIELIIVDDSTNKETIVAIDNYNKDSRVIIIRDTKKIGFVPALNIGLKLAKGDYIARMDSDDISELNRLEREVLFLEENNKYSIVCTAIKIINENGVITSQRIFPPFSALYKIYAVFRCPFSHPTLLMRREIVDKGFYYDENFKKSEDAEFWLRLMKNGYLLTNTTEFLLRYRVCGDLSSKRRNEHWFFNHKARVKNFSFKYPLFSVMSVIVSFIYYKLTPRFMMTIWYKFQNKNS